MSDTRKHLVFLDVDGVLTSNRVHFAWKNEYEMWARFDPIAVDFFNKIHFRYRVEFCLMTTWKNHLNSDDRMIRHWVESSFRNSGFQGKFASPWKTNPENCMKMFGGDRAYEVKHYLETYGQDIDDYILFDDNTYRFNEVLGKKRLVRTDPENGLLYKHMKNAASLMGNWHER